MKHGEIVVYKTPQDAGLQFVMKDQRIKLDLQRHNKQYPPIQIHTFSRAHDRFLIIDEESVYHIGASLKGSWKKVVCIFED